MVKRVGDQALGVPTICHVCKMRRYPAEDEKLTMKKPKPQQKANTDQEGQPEKVEKYFGPDIGPQFIGNLLMKYNLKAKDFTVNQEFSSRVPILDKDTMLMGLDVVSSILTLNLAFCLTYHRLIPVVILRTIVKALLRPWVVSTTRSRNTLRATGRTASRKKDRL